MANVIEELSRDDTLRRSWQDRFHYKWPNLTSMMHQSELTIHPQLHIPEFSEETLDTLYRNPKLPGWEGSTNDLYADPKTLDHEILEEESSTNGSNTKTEGRKCEKLCRNCLCGFLIFSILAVIIAAVGLSIFLTQENRQKGLADHHDHSHGGHIQSDISLEEQAYLTKKFCNLVKLMLSSVDFPVEKGIETCVTALMFVPKSDAIHIEMHVQPKKGYTLKEKLLRALKEEVLVDGVYRVDRRGLYLHTTGKVLGKQRGKDVWRTWLEQGKRKIQITEKSEVQTERPSTELNSQGATDNSSDILSPKLNNAIALGSANFSINKDVTQGVTETTSASSPSSSVIQTANKIPQPKENVVSATTFGVKLSPIFDLSFPKVVTANSVRGTTEQVTVETISTTVSSTEKATTERVSTTVIPTERPVPVPTSDVAREIPFNTELATTTTQFIDTDAQEGHNENSFHMFHVPKATRLFLPSLDNAMKVPREEVTTAIPIAPKGEQNMAAESLMAGGVMKFPLKTKSNFRFLLLSDTDRSPITVKTEPVNMNRVETSKINIVNRIEPKFDIKESFTDKVKAERGLVNIEQQTMPNIIVENSIEPKFDIKEAVTEPPTRPEPIFAIRQPIQATKSYTGWKLEGKVQWPRKRVDVTTFG